MLESTLNKGHGHDQVRFDAIDGLRAVAVLSVIAFHFNTDLVPAGFIGVDIFFVISGYVIALSLARNTSTSIPRYLLEFYKRRIVRIMPALVVCLLVVGIVSELFIPDSWLSRNNYKTGFMAFFGLSNFALLEGADGYFSDRVEFNPFLHTWSLAVEEQFYLFFPLLFLPWLRATSGKGIFAWLRNNLVLVVGLMSLVWVALETSRNPQLAFYMLPSRFWELAAGAVLFQYQSRGGLIPQNHVSLRLASIAGLVLITFSLVRGDIGAFPFPWALLPVLGTLALISAVRSPVSAKSCVIRLLRNPFVVYIGRASYSLYLWHWPVVVMMRWTIGFETVMHLAAGFLLTLVLGISSYHLIERAFLTSTRLRRWPARVIVPAGVAFTLVAAVGFHHMMNSRYQLSVINKQAGWQVHDMPDLSSVSATVTDEDAPTLWVVGDSHAGAYSGMVREAAARSGMKYKIKGVPGCSVVNLQAPNPDVGVCRNSLSKVLGASALQHRGKDVVFLASLRGQRLSDQWGMYEPSQLNWILNSDRSELYQKAYEESRELVGEILSMGFTVIIDTPKPVFRAPLFRCSDWFNNMNPVCAPGFEVSKDNLMEIDAPVLKNIQMLKAEYPELVIWDPFPILCPGDVCTAMLGGKPMFFDQDHMSGYGNQLLVDPFTRLLQEIQKSSGAGLLIKGDGGMKR